MIVTQERKRLVLIVHPRRCGLLLLTGLRWRLFGEVSVSISSSRSSSRSATTTHRHRTHYYYTLHPPSQQIWASAAFSRPGPLLQDSLEKRASRARASNPLLANRIVPELPLLEATLHGVPDTLYQGEMVQGLLRVANRGKAPAAHIYVKSNPPSWIFLRDPTTTGGGAGVGAGAAGEVCMSMVGVSGTVFRVDPSKASSSSHNSSSSLAPGQSLEVPIWVRGLGGGKQALRLLLRYERAGGLPHPQPPTQARAAAAAADAGAGEDQQYRYAHVAVDVCVLPSVALAPSVSPSYGRPGECVLSLNATNYRTDGDPGARRVELHSVCVWMCGCVLVVCLFLFF